MTAVITRVEPPPSPSDRPGANGRAQNRPRTNEPETP